MSVMTTNYDMSIIDAAGNRFQPEEEFIITVESNRIKAEHKRIS